MCGIFSYLISSTFYTMKRSVLLSTAFAASLLAPIATLAAEYRPSEQNMIFATKQREVAVTHLEQLESQLDVLLRQREKQEVEYYNTFEALNAIQDDLIEERSALEDWIDEQIQTENDLLKQLQLQGAPHNVLKVRTRQRQLLNANMLFAEQRDALMTALEEKEQAWQQQWDSLTASQAITRAKFGSQERTLRRQIERAEFDIASIDQMRTTGRSENVLRSVRKAWDTKREEAYKQRLARRTAKVEKALEKAEVVNYFNTPNEEVVAQIQAERMEEIQFEQSMQMKTLMERLGIVGPVNDQLRASLYLHLFGSVPASEEDVVEEETPAN